MSGIQNQLSFWSEPSLSEPSRSATVFCKLHGTFEYAVRPVTSKLGGPAAIHFKRLTCANDGLY